MQRSSTSSVSSTSSSSSFTLSTRHDVRPITTEDVSDPSQWTRHPTLYLQDGTVVLLAGTQLFRVYSGLLSRHSEVFSGMFSMSDHQPDDADYYDGVPLVRLSDDPEDLVHFLSVLHDFHYFPDTGHPVPFRIVAGTLRLATKYIVQPMRNKAIDYLFHCYSANFDRYFTGNLSNRVSVFGSEVDAPHPFTLITFLRECNVPKLLPHAFLEACELGFDALLWGEKLIDKDEVIRLSPEDTRTALDGWQLLREAELKILLAIYDEFAGGCPWGTCADWSWTDGLKDDLETFTHDRSILPFTPRRLADGFCPSCIENRTEFVRDELRKVWEEVPDYFRLPPWEDLMQPDE